MTNHDLIINFLVIFMVGNMISPINNTNRFFRTKTYLDEMIL